MGKTLSVYVTPIIKNMGIAIEQLSKSIRGGNFIVDTGTGVGSMFLAATGIKSIEEQQMENNPEAVKTRIRNEQNIKSFRGQNPAIASGDMIINFNNLGTPIEDVDVYGKIIDKVKKAKETLERDEKRKKIGR